MRAEADSFLIFSVLPVPFFIASSPFPALSLSSLVDSNFSPTASERGIVKQEMICG